jgi:hypothetical protein
MSMLNDLKKVLFGAKSVARSAADKAVESGKEIGEELIEKSAEFIEKAADKTGEWYDKAKTKTDEITEKIWDEINELSNKSATSDTQPPLSQQDDSAFQSGISDEPETTRQATDDIFSQTGEQVRQTASDAMDAAEKIGGKVLEKSAELGDKLKGVAEDLGSKLFEKGGEAFDRAKEAGARLWEKTNDMIEKAQEAAEKDALEEMTKETEALQRQAEAKARAADKSADSTLGGFDSFFDKAERFAGGDYHDKSNSNQPELGRDPDFQAETRQSAVPGFEDLDGDGNEIIDDAILDDKP